jgi:hypothetical protein
MTTAVQHRRGTTAEHATFTGLEGEVTIDTTKDTAVIHDGSLAGGYPLAKENLANVSPSGLPTIDGASTASDDKFFIYDQSATTLKSITRAELNNAMEADALANVSITGGTINGTTIGASTASSGAFTTLTASSTATLNTLASSGATLTGGSINNMAIGASTASSGAFTTLSASGAVTLSGGTANGVAYLNGSKVLTTGSALTFDGTTFNVGGRIGFSAFSSEVDNFALYVSSATSATTLASFSTNPIAFRVNNSEQMRLTSTGLGIGTSSPSYRLDAVSASGVAAQITSGTGGVSTIFKNLSSGTSIVQFTGTTTTNPVSLGAFGDVFILNTSGSERLRIDSSGNLGLGVTPSAWDSARAFQFGPYGGSLAGSTGQSGIYLNSNVYYSSGAWRYATNGTATQYKQNENTAYGGHSWLTAPSGTAGNAISFTQAMTLDASGNLLLGTTSNTYVSKLVLYGGASSNTLECVHTGTANTYNVIFTNGNGVVGSIQTSGSATSYVTSSDYRLKNTIAPMTGALAKVALLKPCTYKWNADGSDGEGFIAHELAEVVPQCVTGEKDAVDADGNPVYQGIDTSFLVATLTAAIQELKAEFDAYKATHP